MFLEYDVLSLLDDTAEVIADHYGHNVPYCESMDMSLFPQVVYAMLDGEKPDLGDLQFLAQNGRLLPKELADATLDEFRAYCREHRKELLSEIAFECEQYQQLS